MGVPGQQYIFILFTFPLKYFEKRLDLFHSLADFRPGIKFQIDKYLVIT